MYSNKVNYLPFGTKDIYYDLFPQYLITLYKESGTLQTCIDTDSLVINGQGFEVDTFQKLKPNNKGQTVKDLLALCSRDLSIFNGFALHVSFNGMLEVSKVTHIPFHKLRQPIPTENGTVTQILETSRYDNLFYGLSNAQPYNDRIFDKFNPNRNFLTARAGQVDGLENYSGQVYYFYNPSLDNSYYPMPKWESVIIEAENERDISKSLRYDIQDGFKPSIVVTEYGKSKLTNQEKIDKRNEYEEYAGVDGARIKLNFAENKESKPDIEVIDSKDLDKNYKFADDRASNKIKRNFKYPDVIYGIATAGKLGQTNELETSVQYANAIAKNNRESLEIVFEDIFSKFTNIQEINPTLNFKIRNFSLLDIPSVEEVKEDVIQNEINTINNE